MQKADCECCEEEECGPAELPVVSASDEEIRQSHGTGEYPIAFVRKNIVIVELLIVQ